MAVCHAPALSIVIVNWNTRELLGRCLASIRHVTLPNEVIVVDNASSDGSPDMVRADFPSCVLLANPRNLGFAAACNQGIALARGKYILLLNSDVEILEGSVSILRGFLESHPGAGVAAPALLLANGKVQPSSWRGYPSLYLALADALYLWKLARWLPFLAPAEIIVEDTAVIVKADHVLGACMLVRREAAQAAGPLDEAYFLYLEETDWCFQIRRSGYSIHHVPAARVIHLGRQSTRQNPSETLPRYYRSYCRFCRRRRQFGSLRMGLLKLVIALAGMIRLALWSVRFLFSDRGLSRKMIAGYWTMLKQLPTM